MCCGRKSKPRRRPKSGLKKKTIISEVKKEGPETTPGQNTPSN